MYTNECVFFNQDTQNPLESNVFCNKSDIYAEDSLTFHKLSNIENSNQILIHLYGRI